MGILEKIKSVFLGNNQVEAEFEQIIADSLEEHTKRSEYLWNIEISKLGYYQNNVAQWPNRKKLDFVIYCMSSKESGLVLREGFAGLSS